MSNSETPQLQPLPERNKTNRPLSLSVILVFSFTLHAIFLILLILAFATSELIQSTLQQYYRNQYITIQQIRLLAAGGALVMAGSLAGIILMWRLRHVGFFIYLLFEILLFVAIWRVLGAVDLINLLIAAIIVAIMAMHLPLMK